MNKTLLIIGASGHGKVVAEIAQSTKKYKSVYFIDDYAKTEKFHGHRNLGTSTELINYKKNAEVFVAIGDNAIRATKLISLEENGFSIATLIHPSATISGSASIGKGTVIMAGAIINASTEVGIGSIINTNASVDHDCKIQDFVHISPGATIAGNVTVGSYTWIGAGSTIINNIRISKNSIVGAGGVVIHDIKQKGKYIGVPAKNINSFI